MHIITIGREFGSGGRELGKRLADALGYAYYDREILTAIADYRQLSVVNGRVSLNNPGGTVYRLADGNAPRIDYRDPPELRLRHLMNIIRQAAERK